MHHLLLFLPLLALALFFIFAWPIALILYLPILLGSIFAYWKAWQALRKPPVTGDQAMVGKTAVVLQANHEHLEVRYEGEIWQAVSDKALQAGQEVIIRKVAGLVLLVSPVTESAEG